MTYCGRFAPTPSGPLHEGSLLIALAGWLQARAQGGRWLIRFDDLDTQRCPADAPALILAQLAAHGLEWDGQPCYQSQHLADYRAALARLQAQLYVCRCTRAVLAHSQRQGPDGPLYPGSCAAAHYPALPGHALRLRLPLQPLLLRDGVLGPLWRQPSELGDPLLARINSAGDWQPAYQLAAVLDEQRMGVTEIIRGHDLLGASFYQAAIAGCLGVAAIAHRHLPLVLGSNGQKLSKQNHAPPLQPAMASSQLLRACTRLGLRLDPNLVHAAPAQLLQVALAQFIREKPTFFCDAA